MSKVSILQKAIQELSDKEYREFRQKFLEQDWKRWDRQIEADSQAGRLDFLIEEALDAKKQSNLKKL